VILSCNNFEVIDLGVMVDKSDIIRTAIEKKVDFIGLSGLITPSLDEMCHVAQAMEEAGLTIPLMIGGATTSALHTAVKIAPNYSGPVFHVKDAAQNPVLASQLMQPESKKQLINQLKEEQQTLRDSLLQKESYVSIKEANRQKLRVDWEKYDAFVPNDPGIHELEHISIEDIRPYINWTYFFHAWKISGDYSQIAHIKGCDACRASWLAAFPEKDRQKAAEAMQLYKEANRLIDRLQMDLQCGLKARFGLFKAFSTDNVICIEHENRLFKIPVLRQQMKTTR
jgi:Methionine synthase I, cobalamin-binding domain